MKRDAAPQPSAAATYGVLQLGATQVALPLDALREVVPCPARFAGLPASVPGLSGAINLRGKVMPVLDLRERLGLEAAPVSEPVVVMMRHERRLLGLRADGVRGITRPGAGALHNIRAEGGLLFSGSFERPEDGSIVSVLNPAAVLALPGLPTLHEQGDDVRELATRSGSTRRALMLVRCGSLGLAMDVADIHTTLPRVTLKPSCLGGAVCRGVIEHGDIELPAVDPLALMGLGSLPQGEACEALLLRLEQGFVALLVSQVIDIAQVTEDELLPLPRLALRRPELFRAVLRVAGRGEHLVLATGVMPSLDELQAMADMNIRRAGPSASAVAAGEERGPGRSVITFDVGAEVAAPLTDVREIVSLPADRARPEARHPAIVGLFSHRGHAVTLLCLPTLLGRTASFDEASARVLLVGHEGSAFGFVVPRLCNIEVTVWQQAAEPTGSAAASSTLGQHPLVEVGPAGQRRTLPLLDLKKLALQVLGDEAGVAPRPQLAPAPQGAREVAAAAGLAATDPEPIDTPASEAPAIEMTAPAEARRRSRRDETRTQTAEV